MFRWLSILRQLLLGRNPKRSPWRSPGVGNSTPSGEFAEELTPSREDDFIYELPFPTGARFQVLQGYGGSYSHTGKSYYSIDFRMPEYTPICASRGGVVYRVVDHFSEGGTHPSLKPKWNAIYVLHVDDTISSYGHLIKNGARVRPGQIVRVGQTIGFSGNTGWSGCPHLHFHVADVAYQKRIPTVFNTAEHGNSILEAGKSYTRPMTPDCKSTRAIAGAEFQNQRLELDRDPFVFSPELLAIRDELVGNLSAAGFEICSDYSSVDVLHDVHGLEVCGIRTPDQAIQITRQLLRLFPGWTPGWLHPPETSSQQGWIATIQRDRDLVMEYWDTD
jgi:murein DD-endopeptidase MepM/ murein hydrolase activator NlpD